MRATVHPGSSVGGEARVPGDKSIAHRWLMLAATARGASVLRGLPDALDVRSTAKVLAALSAGDASDALEGWASRHVPYEERDGSTANAPRPRPVEIRVQAEGRPGLHAPSHPLDCGNSGTTMRLLAGLVSTRPFEAELIGDESLSVRPMERMAAPLREMGASVTTTQGHPPVRISGGGLRGISYSSPVPSAQVKGAVLLAALGAEGETSVEEPAGTRDHTERALAHLGAPIETSPGRILLRGFEHEGFAASVPGDISSAAFLVAAAALTGRELVVHEVGLNPSRRHFLAVLARMGVRTHVHISRAELGEPVGTLEVEPCDRLTGTTVVEEELPLVIDEVPILAMVAAHARGESWFLGAGELRLKESDRVGAIEAAVRALGGTAAGEGQDLVVAGGGLGGGTASAAGDHRIAMAIAVAGLAADAPVTVEGVEAANVSFPGFLPLLAALGARIE